MKVKLPTVWKWNWWWGGSGGQRWCWGSRWMGTWGPNCTEKKHSTSTTTLISTDQGQSAVKTVGIKKIIPRQQKHTCHLCGESFEMQVSFTTHYAKEHPNYPFQCEYCSHTVLSPKSLFKHQHSHLYLKHVCDICQKRFQFPGQLQWYSKNSTQAKVCSHVCIVTRSIPLTVQCLSMPSHIMWIYNVTYALCQYRRGTTACML